MYDLFSIPENHDSSFFLNVNHISDQIKEDFNIRNLFSEEAIVNVLGEIRESWDYGLPTSVSLELAVSRGLKKFYPVEQLGGAHNFTDIAVVLPSMNKVALDVKGKKSLRTSKKDSSQFKKSPRVEIIVRRPTIELENFQGNPYTILHEQKDEYEKFAYNSSTQNNCKTIVSFICLYAETETHRSMYLETQPFEKNSIERACINKKTYEGYDANNVRTYKIVRFSTGSSNFYRTFTIYNTGIHYTFRRTEKPSKLYTMSDLLLDGCIK